MEIKEENNIEVEHPPRERSIVPPMKSII